MTHEFSMIVLPSILPHNAIGKSYWFVAQGIDGSLDSSGMTWIGISVYLALEGRERIFYSIFGEVFYSYWEVLLEWRI